MTDGPVLVRMEALRLHTLYGAGHEHPHAPGAIYEVEAPFVELLIVQGMARRADALSAAVAVDDDRQTYDTTAIVDTQKTVLTAKSKPKK